MPRVQRTSSSRSIERLQPSSLALAMANEEEKDMPSITFEPPTPVPMGSVSRPAAIDGMAPGQQAESSQASQNSFSDAIFTWQESQGHDFPSESRPSSMSGWSLSGTSASGEEKSPLHVVSEDGSPQPPKKRSSNKSHSKKKAPGHVNRPRNAFILFRSHAIKNSLIPTSLGVKDNRAISCIVANLWKSLPEDEKREWTFEAQKEKELHRLQYPDYRFKPDTGVSKPKPRNRAKAQESEKEQCELIADQILRSHGRNIVSKEGGEKKTAARTKSSVAEKARLAKGKDVSKAEGKKVERDVKEEQKEQKEQEEEKVQEEEQYTSPLLTSSRRRSSSVPQLPHHQTLAVESDGQCFASWQTRLAQAERDTRFIHRNGVDLPQSSFSMARNGLRPAALDFTLHGSSLAGEADFASPRTLSTSVPPLPSPRFHHSARLERPKSATPAASPRQITFSVNQDVMLLSPLQASFYDMRRSSIGWQSWSRYSTADLALPIMKPRQSVTGNEAGLRRQSAIDQNMLFGELERGPIDDDDVFVQASRAANISLHGLSTPHSFMFPTNQQSIGAQGKEEEADVFHFGHDFLEQAVESDDVDQSNQCASDQDALDVESKDEDMIDCHQGPPSQSLSFEDGEIVPWNALEGGSQVGDAKLTFDDVQFFPVATAYQ